SSYENSFNCKYLQCLCISVYVNFLSTLINSVISVTKKMSFESVDNVLQYLLSRKGILLSPQEKLGLKEASDYLIQFSKENGLTSDVIKTLTKSVIFEDCYDITTRRKLLYSCVPQSEHFPYEVIPLAVSYSALPNISSTWQYSILTWIAGLLDFHVIDVSNKYIHICYVTLFNLIYKFFRPDLVVSRLDRITRNHNPPKFLAESLKNAQLRLQETDSYPGDGHQLWAYDDQKRRLNPFHDANAIPEPEILMYHEKIEQKKENKISVLQFRSVRSMIRDMPHWKDWIWPNNYACLLSRPALIVLFKPHDPFVKICLTNWLEIALRTEIIDDCGSHARQESLLVACIKLLKVSETIIPAVFHFLMEFLMKWDQYTHFSKVTELLSFFPFISPILFFDCVFEKFLQVLSTASLPQFCSIIDAFGNMASTWLLQARQEQSYYRKASDWPFDLKETTPLEGVYFLCQRLERIILSSILRLGSHTMLLNTIISFYSKINMYCEKLQLPMLVVPPAEFFFLCYVSGDIVAVHRSGHMLANIRERVQFLKSYECSGVEEMMGKLALSSIELINFVLLTYLDLTVSSVAYSERWKEVLSSYVGESFYNKLASVPNIRHFGSICRALPYLPLSCEYFQNNNDFISDRSLRSEVVNEILSVLKSKHLDGILRCAKTYCQ
ncbi:Centromere protein I, partial [Armadillidium nasatum]